MEKGPEIDLTIDRPDGTVWGVEIKSSSAPHLSEVRAGFRAFRESAPEARCIVVHTGPHRRTEDGIEFVPWREYFDALQPPP